MAKNWSVWRRIAAATSQSRYLCRVFEDTNAQHMTEAEMIQIENEVFTKLVIDTLKQQRANGITEFLLDKYQIDTETRERVKKILAEQKK